jgi:succinate dehydrogenase / fumarate reductase membrane anchor subunit
MIAEGSKPKLREGTWLWLLKIAGGLLIVIVLGIHFVINHLVAPGGLLSYQDVINYYKVPIVPIMETIFLLLVVSHSLIGLRSIILDLNPSDRLLKWIDGVLILAGLGASSYGVWLVFFLAAK